MNEGYESMDTDKKTASENETNLSDSAISSVDLQRTGNKDGEIKRKASQDKSDKSEPVSNIDFLLDIPLEITIELDRTTLLINELLKLGQGSVIELSKFAGETLDVLANHRLIAKGEVVVINDKYGIRLTEIISPIERIVRLK